MAAKKETALAKADQLALADFTISKFGDGQLAAVMQENLGGEQLTPRDLERVKIPSGGSKLWIVPDLDDPDGREEKEIEGVIVAQRKTRVFWEKEMGDGEGGPPDCYSTNGTTGRGRPCVPEEAIEFETRKEDEDGVRYGGINCAECPNNQFGSKEGRDGKACKEVQELYLLQKKNVLPVVVPLPPTSGSVFRRYMIRLMNEGIALSSRLFSFTLDRVEKDKSIKYSRVAVKSQALSPEVAEAMAGYADNFQEMLLGKPPATGQGGE